MTTGRVGGNVAVGGIGNLARWGPPAVSEIQKNVGSKINMLRGLTVCVCVCVCFLPIHSGHQVRWTYQPGSHRRKVTQDFSSTFFLRCVP